MIRITNPAHQRRFKADDQEIVLDYCAVKLMQLSIIGSDIYAHPSTFAQGGLSRVEGHGARVMVIWGRKNAAGEFVEAQPLVYEEFSLANLPEQKRVEFFQRPAAPVGEPSGLPSGPAQGRDATIEQREIIVRAADHALERLLTPHPAQRAGQPDRRFGDVRMRDFEEWLVATGKIEGVVE